MKKAIKFYILALTLLFVGLTAFSASAQTTTCPEQANYTLEIPLPGLQKTVCGPAEYLSGIYKLAVGIAVVLAAIMIVYGGIIWSTSGGNPSRQKEARSHITQAIFGLVLLLASYLILRTINPALVNLGELQSRIQGKSQINISPPPTPEPLTPACEKCEKDYRTCLKFVRTEIGTQNKQYQHLLQQCDDGYKNCRNVSGCNPTPAPPGGGGGGAD